MKKLCIILFVFLFALGCEKKDEDSMLDIKNIMENHSFVIVDVRTKEEFLKSHVENAILIPYDTIDENVTLSKEDIIFVYCQSGSRSKVAFSKLKKIGYTVYDLGGIDSISLPKVNKEGILS